MSPQGGEPGGNQGRGQGQEVHAGAASCTDA